MDIDDFSDDGFDDLPDTALQELENQAIHSTQAPVPRYPQTATNPPVPPHKDDFSDYGWQEDDDLDTTEVTDAAGGTVARPILGQALPASQQLRHNQPSVAPARRPIPPPAPNPNWNPNLTNPRHVIQGPGNAVLPRPLPEVTGLARSQTTVLPNRFRPSQPSQQHPPGDIVAALQQRVRSLETELHVAKGEASILRSNSNKAQTQHNAEVNRLKKLNAEQLSKHERVVEAAVAAEKIANTELQFLQRDIREVNDRRKRVHVDNSTAAAGNQDKSGSAAAVWTPRKATKSWGMADGFDEVDIAISPSKGSRRGNAGGPVAANVGERTPTKGKRKRPLPESPLMALEMQEDQGTTEAGAPHAHSSLNFQATASHLVQASPYEYLHLVLDHAAGFDLPLTFDAFSKFSFPSEPEVSFASIIFQRLPLLGDPQRPMQLMEDFSELMISLWTRCYEEQLWKPIKYLVALIDFTYQLHTTSIAPAIMTSLTPVAQETVRFMAESRQRCSTGVLNSTDACFDLQGDIETSEILTLLYATATAGMNCSFGREQDEAVRPIQDFWRLITMDFAVLLLSPKQETQDIIAMLALLATSALPDSLGPVIQDREPAFVAQIIIERVSAKVVESPRPNTTAVEKRQICLAALQTLVAFTSCDFGAMQVASHHNALPRLVTCLSLAIDSLYTMQMPPPRLLNSEADSRSDFASSPPHEFVYVNAIIHQCVSLIYTTVTGPQTANVADISSKLAASFGASQRYLIALGRLTFAEEDLVMEAGIEGEVVEMAHELLEMLVTPEEGTMISESFGAV